MLTNTLKIIKREFAYILSNKRLMLILIGVPLLYITLFGIMYSHHIVKNIPTAVLDYSNTGLSRALVQSFKDSEKFAVVATANSEAELRRLIEDKKVKVGLVIPHDFAKNIKRGKSTKAMIIVNGTNMLYSNAVLSNANEIIQTVSVGVSAKLLQGKGLLPEKAMQTTLPVEFSIRIWYNPTFNYLNFLLLGLAATAIQQVALMYSAIAFTRERDTGALPELLQEGYSPASLVLGKVLAYFIINMVTVNTLIAECYWLFKIPFRGDILQLISIEAVFFLCILILGVFLSIVCRSELEATQYAMLVAIPSFLFSGFTWPVEAMPPLAQGISAVLPLTYFCNTLRDIALAAPNWQVVLPNIAVLGAASLVLLPLSILALKWQCSRLLNAGQQQVKA
ncbi:ABC-2 type transport system permease protein [Desulfohalotomaculum tongense]|uniref:ABC transporter permease n=1 Tax=Desulforadius tongensis TaxID=1216062 RepID=UPI0019571F21|nr:ABC transporter permease [Desulforadius tongensis]MBM7853653.1 ABC-2 type transport system permease protein [Desulforadius tongensis]